MSFSQTGKIKRIFDERHISENFNVREFVLTTGEDTPYPQDILFTLKNTNCDLIIGKHPGDKVEVCFNLRGKYASAKKEGYNHLPFNTLEAWRIYKDEHQ